MGELGDPNDGHRFVLDYYIEYSDASGREAPPDKKYCAVCGWTLAHHEDVAPTSEVKEERM